ncbi:hypothetical protein L2W58_00440 [Dethiosulfovibrio sp. F2B]|uniref:hypothetical protein n=1 Tax=Dethiosulfovibrio faecalis TaxID=2720018 RepID=UPI001F41BFBD|nr:hypothetical protein [Dethiosulfovibrio faecalis]MCF4150274.1 hypothetical protein [Dethiosulfovibrio faecalis]
MKPVSERGARGLKGFPARTFGNTTSELVMYFFREPVFYRNWSGTAAGVGRLQALGL